METRKEEKYEIRRVQVFVFMILHDAMDRRHGDATRPNATYGSTFFFFLVGAVATAMEHNSAISSSFGCLCVASMAPRQRQPHNKANKHAESSIYRCRSRDNSLRIVYCAQTPHRSPITYVHEAQTCVAGNRIQRVMTLDMVASVSRWPVRCLPVFGVCSRRNF